MRTFIKACHWEHKDASKNDFIRYFEDLFGKFLLLIDRCNLKYHVKDELFLQLDVMKTSKKTKLFKMKSCFRSGIAY
jgi:hypothetical protein